MNTKPESVEEITFMIEARVANDLAENPEYFYDFSTEAYADHVANELIDYWDLNEKMVRSALSKVDVSDVNFRIKEMIDAGKQFDSECGRGNAIWRNS